MGAGTHGGFSNTAGSNPLHNVPKENNNTGSLPSPFDNKGHITLQSIAKYKDFFINHDITEIQSEMTRVGYDSTITKSNHSTSRAQLIVVMNSNIDRNIKQLQVSPGSPRHGNVPYVKISTTDIGKIKIVNSSPDKYKSDGKERATIIFGGHHD